jgi:hypothetical protein
VLFVNMFGVHVPEENKDSCFYIPLCNTAVLVGSKDSC